MSDLIIPQTPATNRYEPMRITTGGGLRGASPPPRACQLSPRVSTLGSGCGQLGQQQFPGAVVAVQCTPGTPGPAHRSSLGIGFMQQTLGPCANGAPPPRRALVPSTTAAGLGAAKPVIWPGAVRCSSADRTNQYSWVSSTPTSTTSTAAVPGGISSRGRSSQVSLDTGMSSTSTLSARARMSIATSPGPALSRQHSLHQTQSQAPSPGRGALQSPCGRYSGFGFQGASAALPVQRSTSRLAQPNASHSILAPPGRVVYDGAPVQVHSGPPRRASSMAVPAFNAEKHLAGSENGAFAGEVAMLRNSLMEKIQSVHLQRVEQERHGSQSRSKQRPSSGQVVPSNPTTLSQVPVRSSEVCTAAASRIQQFWRRRSLRKHGGPSVLASSSTAKATSSTSLAAPELTSQGSQRMLVRAPTAKNLPLGRPRPAVHLAAGRILVAVSVVCDLIVSSCCCY
ncbi:unnamed protein product [Polarella glacialis]|uniref:Uncharacterized protein n=1 Tax=Polarella glacialis TaxID=89957 RepID=A0A813ILT1_POLGL|nr:unnamed protein product [Polarella glacialis]